MIPTRTVRTTFQAAALIALLAAGCGPDPDLRREVDELLARFEAERQALDHPYIARVFDAGVTEGGLSGRRPLGHGMRASEYPRVAVFEFR